MDPTKNLEEQLELAANLVKGIEEGQEHTWPDYEVDGMRLAELVLALHEWICKDGIPPQQWIAKNNYIHSRTPEEEKEPTWTDKAREDALNMVTDDLLDDIVEDLRYGRSIYQGNILEKCSDLVMELTQADYEIDAVDAIQLMDELRGHLETDEGVYTNHDPEEALKDRAYYTYRNSVTHYVQEWVKEISEDPVIKDAASEEEVVNNETLKEMILVFVKGDNP